jgi:L-threonylcarbamoyladenylate synthase
MSSSENNQRPVLAKKVSTDSLEECGQRLRDGYLVAFPTETVYGLGCHALDPSAITKVFEAKERPLTDPLIVHVTERDHAFELWNAESSSKEGKVLLALCQHFWPGPLTLVAKAASHVPPILMANTGFVACRSPSHPVARALIDASRVPLAAPSANKFGHVSPTRANHVWDDLLHEDVWIIETETEPTDANSSEKKSGSVVCNVGVESTVAKVEMLDDQGRVTLLRQGAISVADIQVCLEQAGLADGFVVEAHTKKTTEDHVATVAPGQTIRHYSPHIPSFILAQSRCLTAENISPTDEAFLAKSVIIDFGAKLTAWKERAIAYRDLSQSGDGAEAATAVFDTLRWAEQVEGATQILFPEIEEGIKASDALTLALKDRLTRAASGEIIEELRL